LTGISRLPVCQDCLDRIHPFDGPRCAACGERLVSAQLLSERDGALLCGACRLNEPVFDRASAYGSYQDGLRDLIQLLKYEGVRPAASVLGRMLAEVVANLADAFASEPPVVLPVPLHSAKLRQRGFNQSELVARAALKLKPAALDVRVNTSVLARHRATASQTELTPPQRRENVRGAFRVARPADIAGRDVLLVDDVFTTGTTVSECARALRRAGAQRVFVATVARVLKPEVERISPGAGDLETMPQVLAAHA
jgi:ComF family protein